MARIAAWRHSMNRLFGILATLLLSTPGTASELPNVVLIYADDKYGQGIVNREFLSENKVFYHQSVESALAAI